MFPTGSDKATGALQLLATGVQQRFLLRDMANSEICRMQWSPDGTCLAVPSVDGAVRLWNAHNGTLTKTLKRHDDRVYSVAWSPDNRWLASTGRDRRIVIWDATTGEIKRTIFNEDRAVYSVTWSPGGALLASASHDHSILLHDPLTGEEKHKLEGHTGMIYSLAWSSDGTLLASGAADKTIRLWSLTGAEPVCICALDGHTQTVIHVSWSSDGTWLASCAADKTIRIWDVANRRERIMIEGHNQYVTSAVFSADNRLLASKSGDGTVRLWRCDTWELVTFIPEPRSASGSYLAALSFHPKEPLLASLGEHDAVVRIWSLDETRLLASKPATTTLYYSNAKVLLVGDSGVGKSGLSQVLTGGPFQKTESTHNREVHIFETTTLRQDSGVEENREILLWDLAGQPGYRLIHQLYLDDVSVALVVFDARNEIDPFSGVLHWARALRQAQRDRQQSGRPIKIFLVAARVDRGSIGVSRKRIDQVLEKLGFDGYFETSAKEGWQIDQLAKAIREAIDWNALPRISSTEMFAQIKQFLNEERATGIYLSNQDNLYSSFLRLINVEHSEALQAQFDTCLSLIASRGLIERLSFGDMVLLRPEALDSYAWAIVNAAKSEPDGLGYIREASALAGEFPLGSEYRIQRSGQEKLLLIATVEKLLRHEIALRVEADDASYLVFPSQLTREHPDLPLPTGRTVKFRFEGAILNIYTTLVVRLAQSGMFRLNDMWKNAAGFLSVVNNATCGLYLNELSENRAELTLFYDVRASQYIRFQFEEYVHMHLRRRTHANSLNRVYFTACPECNYVVPEQVVELRKQRNFDSISCPVCNTTISLTSAKEATIPSKAQWISRMDKVANQQRDRAAQISSVGGKQEVGDFDVFLCHNNRDKAVVKRIGQKLRQQGLLPWLDEWELRPGMPWQNILEEQIQKVKAAAVFVGENGVGPWQDMEQAAFIREFVQRGCPVIPIVLPSCQNPPQLPYFLTGMTWVDFRKTTPDPLQQLVWGITGERENIVS